MEDWRNLSDVVVVRYPPGGTNSINVFRYAKCAYIQGKDIGDPYVEERERYIPSFPIKYVLYACMYFYIRIILSRGINRFYNC